MWPQALALFFVLWCASPACALRPRQSQNVFAYPAGGTVDTTAPVIIQWIPSAGVGAVSLTLLRDRAAVATISGQFSPAPAAPRARA